MGQLVLCLREYRPIPQPIGSGRLSRNTKQRSFTLPQQLFVALCASERSYLPNTIFRACDYLEQWGSRLTLKHGYGIVRISGEMNYQSWIPGGRQKQG